MATPGGGGGFGRGGRGAAILQALQKKVPRPGETPAAAPSAIDPGVRPLVTAAEMAPSQSIPVVPPAAPAPAAASMGRGAMMAMMMAKKKAVEAAATANGASSASFVPVIPGGSRAPSETGSSVSASRSFPGLVSMSGSSFPVAPSMTSTSASLPPVQQMREMRLQEHPPPSAEKGKEGKQVPLVVNHIPIRIRQGKGIFEYAVLFQPDLDNQRFKFKLVSEQSNVLGATRSFDGSKLYLPHKLQQPVTVLRGSHPGDGTQVEITFKYIKEQKLGDCVHHFNVLFRRVMHAMDLVRIGRHTFNPKGAIQIPKHRLEMWPGFITAIQEYEGGLMLLAEVSHRILRTLTVLDMMLDIYHGNRTNFKDVFMKEILGSIIMTRYNNKTYRVDDVLWDSNPTSTFETSAGRQITYLDYYKQSYNIDIQDQNQPLLLHMEKKKKGEVGEPKRLCMIPELCNLTGLSDDMRSDFHVMKDIGSHTRIAPTQRQAILTKFIEDIYECPKAKEILDSWGVEIMPSFAKTEGRTFQNEVIVFGGGDRVYSGKEGDWSRDAVNKRVVRAVDLDNFVIIHCQRDRSRVTNFISTLQKVGPQMGIRVSCPKVVSLPDDRNDTLMRFLRANITDKVQIVIIVNPTSRDDRYNVIKKICCVDFPVPSQVINGRTIDQMQKLRSVTQKIALQINCKLGGELWAVEIPLNKLMVIGMDAYHDNSHGKKSVLGFVFSVNQTLTRWSCQSCFQTSGQEFGSQLKMNMVFALKKYFEVNHYMPEKIILFRDGVGDGQLEFVSKFEVEQVISSFTMIQDCKPTLTVVVVQKRINTRIFMPSGGRYLENPPPGTVLDHTVTRKNWYDFFLVSQHVRQGTVTPTHYVVVHNDSNLKPDHIQRIAYKMTHLYYNWPGTIRVPAPCQYAHRLAALVGQNIHKEPDNVLCDRLFFL